MKPASWLIVAALFSAASLASAQTPVAATPPVTITQDDQRIILDNGLVTLEINRDNGQATALRTRQNGKELLLASGRDAMYWDANASLLGETPAGAEPPKKGYFRSPQAVRILCDSPQRGEVAVTAGPSQWFQFKAEYHWVMFPGQRGFYAFVLLEHTPEFAAAELFQTRFVIKTNTVAANNGLLDTWSLGDGTLAKIPTAARTEQLMDATFRLEDGTVATKYQQSVYWAKAPVYGYIGPGVGLWSITASPEYHNGGPIKQGQTVHDNVLLRVLQSVHFGASSLKFEKGESWKKLYGPFFTYVNTGQDAAELQADARRQQQAEAAQWPYAWMNDPAYSRQRGALTGQWKLPGATHGAWAILAAPGGDWAAQGKGYMFWTQTGPDGRFHIPKVIPGRYTLYLSGADQPEEFVKNDIEIAADRTTDLGTLDWKPVTHGRTLWQIGVFDRTAAEFRNGEDARHFEMFKEYPKQFPNDIDFTIGKSDPGRDWNYAQWVWYAKSPVWRIRFDLPQAPAAGQATLTLAFAAAQPIQGNHTNLQVAVNGKQIEVVHLPKTGTSGYRGGVQDSQYNVKYLTFDASLLHAGTNEVTLGHAEAAPFPNSQQEVQFNVGHVMYDALKLELPH